MGLTLQKAWKPAAVAVETGIVTRQDSLNVELGAGGGFIARFASASD
jgi:hypothetical protein